MRERDIARSFHKRSGSLVDTTQRNPIETVFSEVSPVVGAHVGPGTLGMCYSVDL